MITRRRVLTAGALALTAGCHDAKPAPDVTGRTPRWRSVLPSAYDPGESYTAQRVAVSGGTVLAADRGSLHGFDAAHGTRRWTSPFGPFDNTGLAPAPPQVTGGTAVTLRNQKGSVATLFGTDVATGDRRWVFAGRHVISTPTGKDPGGDLRPAVAGGLVHFVSGPHLYTLDAVTGAVRWKRAVRSFGPPVSSGGVVYVVDERSLVALDAATGSVRWTRDVVAGTVLPGPGALYVVGEVLTELDPRTGRTRWSTARGDWTRAGTTAQALRFGGQPVLAGDRVCLTGSGSAGSGTLWALSTTDGRVRWTFRRPDPFGGPVSVSGGTIYCDASGGHLYAVDARTGRSRWRLGVLAASVNPPVAAGGVVYTIARPSAGTADHLYAFPA